MKLDFTSRPLSWSQISQFQYNPEIWYDKYILNKRTPTNAAMEFGTIVGRRLASEPGYLPEIERIEGGIYEKELRFKVGGINIIGYIDWFHPDLKSLKEFKTGKSWTKEKAEEHGQLKLYSLGLMIQENIKPEDLTIRLYSMETESRGDFTMTFVKGMKPVVHEVKLTTRDCLMFGAELLNIVKEMEEYVDSKLAYKKEADTLVEVGLIK